MAKPVGDGQFQSESFTFVMTEADGQRVFGFCRRYYFPTYYLSIMKHHVLYLHD
jgi:hypothetical protein